MLRFAALTAAGFAGMELGAYALHRWLFHGPLWFVHQTHHAPDHEHGPFEANDVFSLGFAAASMGAMWAGRHDPLASTAFPLGLGVALYGGAYFVLHDLYTHRRFLPFKTENRAAQTIRRAHQRHHQTTEKHGFEPYGLFLFPYDRYKNGFRRTRPAPRAPAKATPATRPPAAPPAA